jgi:hypothetical protein
MTVAHITVARNAETGQPVTRTTTSPTQDVFGQSVGGKTVRHYPMRTSSKSGQVRYKWFPLEPQDTVIEKITFNVQVGDETFRGITKRELNTLLGARQTRKAMRAMSPEDKQTYRAWKKQQRVARS